jgi:hypothetical protein
MCVPKNFELFEAIYRAFLWDLNATMYVQLCIGKTLPATLDLSRSTTTDAPLFICLSRQIARRVVTANEVHGRNLAVFLFVFPSRNVF